MAIQHKSDFLVAMDDELRLQPAGTTWQELCTFAADVSAGIGDQDVSERYQYGEIRLTRLLHTHPRGGVSVGRAVGHWMR